jgi:hypothetical protein
LPLTQPFPIPSQPLSVKEIWRHGEACDRGLEGGPAPLMIMPNPQLVGRLRQPAYVLYFLVTGTVRIHFGAAATAIAAWPTLVDDPARAAPAAAAAARAAALAAAAGRIQDVAAGDVVGELALFPELGGGGSCSASQGSRVLRGETAVAVGTVGAYALRADDTADIPEACEEVCCCTCTRALSVNI